MSSKKKYLDRKIECHRCWVDTDRVEVEVLGPNIEIDICPKCKGIWLDYGELKKILMDRKLSDYLTKNIGTKSKSEMVCPRCGGLMDIERAEDIEVDVCLTCHGVWLDSGELEALKSKSKKGYKGDEEEKAQEKEEERARKARESALYRFLYNLTGK
ncbi:MAG: zf-TFIIB domain-containing protein [Thermoplasmata archaeon]|nr:MAG: zf-TFIIB domain-containing protein [Thermoplasmata archaeon]